MDQHNYGFLSAVHCYYYKYSLDSFTIEVTPLGFISDMSDFFNRIDLTNWSNEIKSSHCDNQLFQSRTKYIVYKTLLRNNIDATDPFHHNTVTIVQHEPMMVNFFNTVCFNVYNCIFF